MLCHQKSALALLNTLSSVLYQVFTFCTGSHAVFFFFFWWWDSFHQLHEGSLSSPCWVQVVFLCSVHSADNVCVFVCAQAWVMAAVYCSLCQTARVELDCFEGEAYLYEELSAKGEQGGVGGGEGDVREGDGCACRGWSLASGSSLCLFSLAFSSRSTLSSTHYIWEETSAVVSASSSADWVERCFVSAFLWTIFLFLSSATGDRKSVV